MTNGVTGVGVNNQNYQMAFKAKGVNKQKALEVIDKLGIQMPREMELSKRPIEEQRERILLKFLSKFKIKDLFTGKVVKPKETTVEHINAVIETRNKACKETNLEVLKETDPELYKEILKRNKQQEAIDISEKVYENFVLKRMMKEDPEKAKVIIHNKIMASLADQLTLKNIAKMEWNYLTMQITVGLGKFLGKCDKIFNKIPLIKEARNKRFAKLEQTIEQRFKDGMIDADQAGELLIKANPTIKKV